MAVPAFADRLSSDKIPHGVTVAGIDVGGLTQAQALTRLDQRIGAPSRRPVSVTLGSRKRTLSAKRAGVTVDLKSAVDKAVLEGRKGNFFTRGWRHVTGGKIHADEPVNVTVDRKAVHAYVTKLSAQVMRAPVDATVSLDVKSVGVTEGKNGRKLSGAKALERRLTRAFTVAGAPRALNAKVVPVQPKVTTDDIWKTNPVVLTVSKSDHEVRVFDKGKLVKTYRVAVGDPTYPTPEGAFKIQGMQEKPDVERAEAELGGRAGRQGDPVRGPAQPDRGALDRLQRRGWLPRHEGARLAWALRLARLHPHEPVGRHRPLPARPRGRDGHRRRLAGARSHRAHLARKSVYSNRYECRSNACMAGSASWLFPDGVDRERLLDMDRRLRPVRRASFGVIAVALLLSGPWLGWWTLLPLAIAAVVFRIADTRIDRTTHPERPVFAAWTASQVIIAISVALTGGAIEPTMAWFAIPLITLGARFSERGIAIGVGITIALILAVAFGVDAGAVIDNPPLVISPIAMVIAIAMMQTVVMRSDVDTRREAVIDPLTGMLNRKALQVRVTELQQQSAVTGAPVGVVVADLDHFKTVNDRFGHAEGDAVLKDVAYALRKALRAFDLVYRIGGEEFLVLLPGADLTATADIAEGLRAAVCERPLGSGQNITVSLGISASIDGDWDYDELFRAADEALYRAKAAGRDCVCGGASSESVSA